MSAPRLTKRLLDAMDEALAFRLAGELDDIEDPEAYKRAQAWVWHQLESREAAGAEQPAAPRPQTSPSREGNPETQRGR